MWGFRWRKTQDKESEKAKEGITWRLIIDFWYEEES